MEFLTFFYPGFSSCERRNSAAGHLVNEWDLLRSPGDVAAPFSAVPLLGYTDTAQEQALLAEINVASTYGVDAFVFNYYYDGVHTELEGPLNICAGSQSSFRFALNLCCRMPRRELRFGLLHDNSELERVTFWTESQFAELCNRILNKYLTLEHYHRIGQSCTLFMYHVQALVTTYGVEGLRRRIDLLRERARNFHLEVRVVGLFSIVDRWDDLGSSLRMLPFDSYSCYVALPEFSSDQPVQVYGRLVDNWLDRWHEAINVADVRIHPCIGAGWDARPRGMPGYDPQIHGCRFPYTPVVIGSNSADFKRYLLGVVSLLLCSSIADSSIVLLGPWNEWSEGCYLLPDERGGYAKLDAIRATKEILRTIRG
jgi:hypothetical protein